MTARSKRLRVAVATLWFLAALATVAMAGRDKNPTDRFSGVIYVQSQDLYYDTFVPVPVLPDKGPFQQLYITPDGPVTEYGPGDPGYLGGRWHVVGTDAYFLCPLIPPGREAP